MPRKQFIWDPVTDAYLMEKDGAGNTTAVYTQEPVPYGNLISQRRDGQTYQCLQDGLGSIRQLTDETGAVTDSYTYTAFGETLSPPGPTENPFRWLGSVGYYHDEATGSYYVRARNYAPTAGRWTSADPLMFVDGTNLYSARFVPSLIDPSGLLTKDEFTKCMLDARRTNPAFWKRNARMRALFNQNGCTNRQFFDSPACATLNPGGKSAGNLGLTFTADQATCRTQTDFCIRFIRDCKTAVDVYLHEFAMAVNLCLTCKNVPNCAPLDLTRRPCQTCLLMEVQAAELSGECDPGGSQIKSGESHDDCLARVAGEACRHLGRCNASISNDIIRGNLPALLGCGACGMQVDESDITQYPQSR